ncbi:MAG TPA: DNA recombination protein RmuC [Xanthomonadales bacterium]|nr:DNA recombination protein RmuC [Xanthomonadales bacterium]
MVVDPNTLHPLSLLLGVLAGIVFAAIAAWFFQRNQAAAASRRLDEAAAAREQLARESGEAAARAQALAERLAEKSRNLDEAVLEVDALREQLAGARVHIERLLASGSANEQAMVQLREFVANAREQLGAKFGEVAGALFDQKSQVFATQSQQQLASVLQPFADELKGFREKAEQLYGDEAKERAAVKGAVEQLTGLNQRMSEQTQALTNALRGNVKHRGNWGEMILDKVLAASGLVDGEHYTKQEGGRDDDGRVRIPDVVVQLPNDRKVVVDSKVNLIAWQEAVNAESDELRGVALKQHVIALRRHVKDVSKKNYAALYDGTALDLVLVFVPIEGALAAAMSEDPDLGVDALDCKVVLVTPNTLVGVLRAIEFSWSRTQSVKSAREIVDRAGKLLEALHRFKSAFERVGSKLREAQNAFESADTSLNSPQGPVNRARIIEALGVKSSKRLGAPEPDAGDEPRDELLGLERQPLE